MRTLMEEKTKLMPNSDMQMLIAGIIPNTKYFDSRFDALQFQINGLIRNQDNIKEGLENRIDSVLKSQADMKEILQLQIDGLQKGQNDINGRLDYFKQDVDKRFDQVDKRFDQIIASIDKLGDKIDRKDEKQRNFTIRMFSVAVSISILGVLGVFL